VEFGLKLLFSLEPSVRMQTLLLLLLLLLLIWCR